MRIAQRREEKWNSKNCSFKGHTTVTANSKQQPRQRERERRAGEVYGRGRGWATDEKVRAGYVIILGLKLKRCSFDFFFFKIFF